MTTELHNESMSGLSLKRLEELLANCFMSDNGSHDYRTGFFELQSEEYRNSEDTWERLLDVETKLNFRCICC